MGRGWLTFRIRHQTRRVSGDTWGQAGKGYQVVSQLACGGLRVASISPGIPGEKTHILS